MSMTNRSGIDGPRRKISESWHFDWGLVDVLISGQSAIDLPATNIRSLQDANIFLESYGYNLTRQEDARLLHSYLVEALSFIERYLMPDEWTAGICPPAEVLDCEDPRQLLTWAGTRNPGEDLLAAWSCSVLRVMHTIAHLQGVWYTAPIHEARSQIMDRFVGHVSHAPDGTILFGSGDAKVELERMDWKFDKPRDSILLKLLHKRHNVAESIYDIIGIRIVTKTPIDIFRVIKNLYSLHIITPHNCVPARAHNNLIDPATFHRELDAILAQLDAGTLDEAGFHRAMAAITVPPPEVKSMNRHSSRDYQAIQMTCRQLIRCENPALSWVSTLRRTDRGARGGRVAGRLVELIDEWPMFREESQIAVFFPFEIQLLDKTSYDESRTGSAAHVHYKSSQLRAARRRVLGEVLRLAKPAGVAPAQ